jgi:hypothetical protein
MRFSARQCIAFLAAISAITVSCWTFAATNASDGDRSTDSATAPAHKVEMFDAMKTGDLQVRYVPKNDREAQIIIKNNTKQPLSVKLPDAFVGVPVLAQIGVGGGGNRANRGGGRNGGGNQNQASGGGGGNAGGGGGFFNVAPEAVGRVKVATVCLEHGKDNPNDRVPYEIRPVETFTTDARVEEVLKMLGNGQVDQRAAQAAAWHFANKMEWSELAAKKIHHLGRPDEPYFTAADLDAATQVAGRAEQQARLHPPSDEAKKTVASDHPSEATSSSAAYSAQP